MDISLNKNSVFGDKSALNPGGVRIGTPALTTRGLKEADFVQVGEFIVECVDLCVDIQKVSGKKLVDFKKMANEDSNFKERLDNLRSRVNEFAEGFEFLEEPLR